MNTTETTPINSTTAPASPALPLEQTPPKPSTSPSSPGSVPKTPDGLGQKIDRLPKPTRDMLNVMLDDSLPYHVILDELGETARGLTPNSLADWVKSGYEDYLKERQSIEQVKTQAEFAADLLHALGDIDVTAIHRACQIIVSLQMFRAIEEFGDEALQNMLRANPSSYLNVLNTLCNMVQPSIDLENHRIALEGAGAKRKENSPAPAAGTGLPASSGEKDQG